MWAQLHRNAKQARPIYYMRQHNNNNFAYVGILFYYSRKLTFTHSHTFREFMEIHRQIAYPPLLCISLI